MLDHFTNRVQSGCSLVIPRPARAFRPITVDLDKRVNWAYIKTKFRKGHVIIFVNIDQYPGTIDFDKEFAHRFIERMQPFIITD
jgi:hypothetical protein